MLILSTHNIILHSSKEKDVKEIRKKVPIAELKYYIKSTTAREVLLYFISDFDFRIIMDDRENFLDLLKLRFVHFCPTRNLRVYGIPKDSLKEYKALTGKNYGYDNEPLAKHRLLKEEIRGEMEESKNLVTTATEVLDDDPNDFDFDNHRSSMKAGPGMVQKVLPKQGPGDRNSDIHVGDDDLLSDSGMEMDNLQDHIMSMQLGG